MHVRPNVTESAVSPSNLSSREGRAFGAEAGAPAHSGGAASVAPGPGLGAQRRRGGEARGAAWAGAAGRLAGASRAGRLASAGRAAIGGRRTEGALDWPRLPARRRRPRALRGDWAGPRLLRLDWLGRSGSTCSSAAASLGSVGGAGAHARPVMPWGKRPGSASGARRGSRRR